MRIAFVGSTSQISKSIQLQLDKEEYKYYLLSRSHHGIESVSDRIFSLPYSEFLNYEYDVIINCVGIADPKEQKKAGYEIFRVNEYYDNLCIDFLLNRNQDCLYIYLSSGAVYGSEFQRPVGVNDRSMIAVNSIEAKDYYRVAKISSEIKHRALSNFNIVDVRVFSFFSRFSSRTSGFFMTDVLNAIINKQVLKTNNIDIVRDYVSSVDLCKLIKKIINKAATVRINDVVDVYSKAPVRKFELLEILSRDWELKYNIVDIDNNITGLKSVYYSTNSRAFKLFGYEPYFTSLEGLLDEIKVILT